MDISESFKEALCDDFNTSKALGEIFAFINDVNSNKNLSKVAKQKARDLVVQYMNVFGIEFEKSINYPDEILDIANKFASYDGEDKQAAVDAILQSRAQARKDKN